MVWQSLMRSSAIMEFIAALALDAAVLVFWQAKVLQLPWSAAGISLGVSSMKGR